MTTAFADLQRIMSPKQIISIADSTRTPLALWVGAVSAGKTFASLWAFLIALRMAPTTGEIVIVGRTLQTIERNIISLLQKPGVFGLLAGQVKHTTGSNIAVICGRTVSLIGASNSESENVIRGMTVSLAYVDEATIVNRAAFDMLVTRLRVDGARLLATTNPGSMNHWLRRKYILRADAAGLTVFHLTMDDNPSLPAGYVARMKRTYTGVFYQRFILGEWTNAEGAVYPDWDPKEHIIRFEDMPPIRRLLAVGVDYGTTNPTVAILLGITDERMPGQYTPTPRLILMDEWVDDPKQKSDHDGNPSTNRPHAPSEHAEMYRRWLAGSRHMPDHIMATDPRPPATIVDPAAKAFREQLARPVGQFATGMPTTAADNDVLAGIGDVGMLISNGLLISTDRCVRWNEEITEYRWDSKKSDEGLDQVVKENDHSLDSGRYSIRTSRTLWLPSVRDAYNLAA
jgi:hypothetical protein